MTYVPEASIGATGSPVPASGMFIGGKDASGNLQGALVDLSLNLRVAPGATVQNLAAWSSATSVNATQVLISGVSVPAVLVVINQTTPFTAGAITFEASYDDINWVGVTTTACLNPSSLSQITLPYTLQASVNQTFLILLQGARQIRIRLSTAITGAGTVTPFATAVAYTPEPALTSIGLEKVAIFGSANQSLETTSGVLDENIKNVGNSAVVTAATGVQKVGIVGNAGAAVDGATAAAVPANAILEGARGATTYPTAVTDGQMVAIMADKAGRQVVALNAPRDLISSVAVLSSSSTLASLIAAGAAGVFNDIVHLVLTNENTASATIVSLSDGTTTYKFALAAGGGASIPFPTPLPATSAATAWQVSNSAAVNVDCVAIYAKNK